MCLQTVLRFQRTYQPDNKEARRGDGSFSYTIEKWKTIYRRIWGTAEEKTAERLPRRGSDAGLSASPFSVTASLAPHPTCISLHPVQPLPKANFFFLYWYAAAPSCQACALSKWSLHLDSQIHCVCFLHLILLWGVTAEAAMTPNPLTSVPQMLGSHTPVCAI